jgi:aerobic-type carbon monoxide dehydrogenase small subunit (CoxS/CutS family)
VATLLVNGERFEVDVGLRRLVDVLRNELGLLGTKFACGEGACGACGVMLDGKPVASCLLLAAAAEGHSIQTIEGLTDDGAAAVVAAFVAEDAVQCGFCTPAQVVSATALLAVTPNPTPEEIRRAMAGNLCRCGTYPKIERAILSLAGSSR